MLSFPSLLFLIAGYTVMIAFFIIQRLLRRTESAKSFRGGPFDKGNMLLVGSATGAGLWLPIILDVLQAGTIPIGFFSEFIALAVMLCGLGIRIWAALSLGRYYTTTLMITENQKVITTGPYARIRHPGYLGEILLWTGFGVLSSNLIASFVLPVMFVIVYLYRISSEERMLAQELGKDYIAYQKRTRKLVPFIY